MCETLCVTLLLQDKISKQTFSGAVAVIAIIHRPAAIEGTATSPAVKPSAGAACAEPQPAPQQDSPVILHVGNVGDCRAVLCRGGKAVELTQEHTPAVPSEAARVEAAGGFVSRGRVNGILGVSRSFGDIHCKVCSRHLRVVVFVRVSGHAAKNIVGTYLRFSHPSAAPLMFCHRYHTDSYVVPTLSRRRSQCAQVYPPNEGHGLWEGQQLVSRPDVHSVRLEEDDNFLILASDGVWDVLTSQQAVSYVHRRLLTHGNVQRAAAELVDKVITSVGVENAWSRSRSVEFEATAEHTVVTSLYGGVDAEEKRPLREYDIKTPSAV